MVGKKWRKSVCSQHDHWSCDLPVRPILTALADFSGLLTWAYSMLGIMRIYMRTRSGIASFGLLFDRKGRRVKEKKCLHSRQKLIRQFIIKYSLFDLPRARRLGLASGKIFHEWSDIQMHSLSHSHEEQLGNFGMHFIARSITTLDFFPFQPCVVIVWGNASWVGANLGHGTARTSKSIFEGQTLMGANTSNY